MKKSLLMIVALAFGVMVNAQTQYFFSPNGEGTGESWDDAAAAEFLGVTLAEAEPGTEFYLMEGSYFPDETTRKWNIAQGVIIKGGYPTTMTGTNTAIDYTKAGQSIFSADLDGDGKGDNADYALVYVGKAGAVSENADGQFYKDVPLTEIWGVTFRDGARVGGGYYGNILFVKHTKLDLHFCKFINNVCGENDKTAAVIAWGSQVRAFDCVFKDNKSNGAGSAFLQRSRESNSSNKEPSYNGISLFERCEFTNNTITTTYGGTLSVADCGGTLYMINCTVTGGSQQYGGAVALGGSQSDGINPPQAYLINNTIVDNVSTRSEGEGWIGGGYRAGHNSHTYLANNVMVNPAAKDNFITTQAVVMFQRTTATFTSAGYNILGTVQNTNTSATAGVFVATDKQSTSASNVNTQEKIFGTSVLANNGGFSQSFMPLAAQATSTSVAALKSAVAAWPMEAAVKEVMNLDVDQRGYPRAATTMSGSIDANAQGPATGVENVAANAIQDGIYYTLQGQAIGKDFQALPSGMYICNGVKIIK